LRRFIDDSVNILMDASFNRIRVEEGRAPLLVLWPWGQGLRYPLPNLAIRRGGPAMVQSESYRMAGLTRLVGYRHGDRKRYRSGLNLDLPAMAKSPPGSLPSLQVISAPADLRAKDRMEELEWFADRFEREYLGPIWEWVGDREAAGETVSLTIASPANSYEGLALSYVTKSVPGRPLPFDERVFDERGVPRRNLHELIDAALSRTQPI